MPGSIVAKRIYVSKYFPSNFKPTVKRNVSSYRKKLVASKQEWRCGHCRQLLKATFHVDHIVPLFDSCSSNDISNLVALCVECHAQKTMEEREE